MICIAISLISESNQTPQRDSGQDTVILSGGIFPENYDQNKYVPENSDEFEFRKPAEANENYDDFLKNLYRYDLQKNSQRNVRQTGRNFNPVIENPSQQGRDDFKDFRQFQTNLNKEKQANPSGRFIRDLGTYFNPVIQTSSSEHITRTGFDGYKNFQRDLNKSKQEHKTLEPRDRRESLNPFEETESEEKRQKRMIIFRPYFVYRNQEYQRQRVNNQNLEREFKPES